MSSMETVYVLRGYFEFFKNYLSFVNYKDDSMIKGKQILILIKTVLDLVYLSQDPTILVDELKKEWIIHADLYFQCVYCLFGKRYQQHLKMHNLLHVPYQLDYFGLPLHFFSVIHFESANSRLKQLLLLSNNRLNKPKTILTKIMWKVQTDIYKENEEISTINNCGWSYDFGDKSCLEMNISKNIAEEKEIEKIVDDINTSILLKSTDETLEESLNDPNDFTWLP
uniref:BTB domain-containing protein n=1 Tax=Strongyloides venezuelensis TaxID=75913 RepID=A0A0K0FW97_STRVS